MADFFISPGQFVGLFKLKKTPGWLPSFFNSKFYKASSLTEANKAKREFNGSAKSLDFKTD